MRFRLGLMLGFGAGFLIGSKSGTEAYDQIMGKFDEFRGKTIRGESGSGESGNGTSGDDRRGYRSQGALTGHTNPDNDIIIPESAEFRN